MAKQNGISAAAFGATLNSGPRDTNHQVEMCDECGVALDRGHNCPKCSVYHGAPCAECGRRGYHVDSCSEVAS